MGVVRLLGSAVTQEVLALKDAADAPRIEAIGVKYPPPLRVLHAVGSDSEERALDGLRPTERAELLGRIRTQSPALLVLDACSDEQTEEACGAGVDHIVTLPARLGREDAAAFAEALYEKLHAGSLIHVAFDSAFQRLRANRLPDELQPRFLPAESPSGFRGRQSADETTSIFFATNRARDADGWAARVQSGLTYGRCDIPTSSATKLGRLPSTTLRSFADGREGTGDLAIFEPAAFDAAVVAALDGNPQRGRDVLVVVHGYRSGFREAARRAAQLHLDIEVPGATMFYSWPSQGTGLGYTADVDAVPAAAYSLYDALLRVSRIPSVEKVHVLAHSMGSRVLLGAVQRTLDRALEGLRLGQLILAAPDTRTDAFSQSIPALRSVSARTSIYVSGRDRALRGSSIVNRAERVGLEYVPPPESGVFVFRADTVDTSLLGHGYYAAARPVLEHMNRLLLGHVGSNGGWGVRLVAEPNVFAFRA